MIRQAIAPHISRPIGEALIGTGNHNGLQSAAEQDVVYAAGVCLAWPAIGKARAARSICPGPARCTVLGIEQSLWITCCQFAIEITQHRIAAGLRTDPLCQQRQLLLPLAAGGDIGFAPLVGATGFQMHGH